MPTEVWLVIALILGFVVAAGAVMALLAWAGVIAFRWVDRRRGPSEGGEQSLTVANGLFELSEIQDPRAPGEDVEPRA